MAAGKTSGIRLDKGPDLGISSSAKEHTSVGEHRFDPSPNLDNLDTLE
jgi:hypothetical protein